ncbi:MAG: hypothetical protein AAFU67_15990, partial [Bacteroidota bacterium]
YTKVLKNLSGTCIMHVRGTNYYEGKENAYFAMVLFRRRVKGEGTRIPPDQPTPSTTPTINPADVRRTLTGNGGPTTDEDGYTQNCRAPGLEGQKFRIRTVETVTTENSGEPRAFNAEINLDRAIKKVTINTNSPPNTYESTVGRFDCHGPSGEKRLLIRDQSQIEYYMGINLNKREYTLQQVGSNQKVIYRE